MSQKYVIINDRIHLYTGKYIEKCNRGIEVNKIEEFGRIDVRDCNTKTEMIFIRCDP